MQINTKQNPHFNAGKKPSEMKRRNLDFFFLKQNSQRRIGRGWMFQSSIRLDSTQLVFAPIRKKMGKEHFLDLFTTKA